MGADERFDSAASSPRNQILLVAVCLPGGVALLWTSVLEVLAMLADIQAAEPVVIVNRLSLAGCGAGLGLIGAGLLVVAADFLQSRPLTRLGTYLFFVGTSLALLAPLPASYAANSVLAEAGYDVCPALSEPSFKLTHTAWVREPELCTREMPKSGPGVGSR